MVRQSARCLRFLLFGVLASAAALGLADTPASFNGSWAHTAVANPADFFTLELIQKGGLLCGRMTATADSSNRTASSFVVGTVNGNRGTLEFEGDWIAGGQHGVARVTLRGTQMDWRVMGQAFRIDAPDVVEGLWAQATLRQQTWNRKSERSLTGWCQGRWQQIERAGRVGLSLRP
jgi:hypothetical protein